LISMAGDEPPRISSGKIKKCSSIRSRYGVAGDTVEMWNSPSWNVAKLWQNYRAGRDTIGDRHQVSTPPSLLIFFRSVQFPFNSLGVGIELKIPRVHKTRAGSIPASGTTFNGSLKLPLGLFIRVSTHADRSGTERDAPHKPVRSSDMEERPGGMRLSHDERTFTAEWKRPPGQKPLGEANSGFGPPYHAREFLRYRTSHLGPCSFLRNPPRMNLSCETSYGL
jgi:hypothetical protein